MRHHITYIFYAIVRLCFLSMYVYINNPQSRRFCIYKYVYMRMVGSVWFCRDVVVVVVVVTAREWIGKEGARS